MRSLAHKIFTFFLVTLMMAFTVGVSVYHHYCACSQQSTASVFVEIACGDKHGEPCCASRAEASHSCCRQGSQNTCSHENTCMAGNCCKTDVRIIQIVSEYQISQDEINEILILPAFVIASTGIISEEEPALIPDSFYTDISPPLYGRQFLTAVHQLKFDIPVC